MADEVESKKRGRGRPPKAGASDEVKPKAEKKPAAKADSDAPAAKRGRGRPAKGSPKKAKGTKAAGRGRPAAKGRGRPAAKKASSEEEDKAEDASEGEEAEDGDE